MRRLLLIVFAVAIAAGALAWWYRAALVELARQEIERELERALGQASTVRALRASLIPPRVWADGIVIGEKQPLASLDEIDLRLATLSTIAEARVVAKINARSLFVDVTRLPEPDADDSEDLPMPAFRIGGMTISDLRVRFPIGDEVGVLSVATARAHVESARLRSLIAATVALKGTSVQRASRTLDLGEIRGSVVQDSGGITIQSASLVAPGRHIEVSGTSPILHDLKGELDLHDLVILDDDLDLYSGPGSVSGRLHGPLARPVIEGALEIPEVRVAGRRLGRLRSRVHHEGETTRFEEARLRGEAGEVHGTVIAKFRREIPIESTLAWHVTNVESLLNEFDLTLELDNQLEATTVITGHFDPLKLDIAAEGQALAGTEVAKARVEARIGKDLTDVEFQLTQAGRSRVVGQVSAHRGALDGRVDLESSDLTALSAVMPRALRTLDLSGETTAAVLIQGSTKAPRFEGTVVGGPLGVAGVQLDRLRGSFAWTEDVLEVPEATLETLGGSAVLRGTVALTPAIANDWQLRLAEMDTDLAIGIARRFAGFPDVIDSGHLTGVVTCKGPWSKPTLGAALVAGAPRVVGEEFARLEVDGEIGAGGWKLRVDATHTSDLRFRVDGGGAPGRAAQVSIAATPVDLENVHLAKRFGVKGVIDLDGHLSGDLSQADGAFKLSASDLAIGQEVLGEIEVRATGEKGRWRIEGEAPARRLAISATAVAKAPFAYTARLDWEELTFDYERSETDRLTGATTGSAQLSGDLANARDSQVAIRLSDLSLQWGDALVGLQTPIVISGQQGRLELQPFTLGGKETSLRIAGSLVEPLDLMLSFEGTASLDYLELLGDPFVSTDGTVDLDLRLRHATGGGWGLEGRAVLQRSVLDFGLPMTFTDASGTLVARGRVFAIEELSATSGGGRLRLSGDVNLDDGPALAWRLDDVGLSPEPGIEGVVSGEGTLSGAWRSLLLRGGIDVKSALYSRDFEIVDIPALFRPRVDAVAPSPPSNVVRLDPSTVVRLDLEAVGRGGLYVDNNVAQIEMSLDGRLKGTVTDPKIIGTVNIIGGTVKVRRRSFTLTDGAADFRGKVPPNPNLNINAETEITTREADYIITATVTGTARDPLVTFASDDPSLAQNDIVSLVAVGRTAAELQGEAGGVSSVDALALLPTAPVEEQVTQLVGIDRFEIDLAQTNSQGDLSPGVTIGKNLTDGFRAALSTTFDVDARNAVVLEYDLTRRISLLGQWEAETEAEEGAFGAGVRMRYEFRRIPLSLLRGRAGCCERGRE